VIVRINHRQYPVEVGMNDDPDVPNFKLPGLCIVRGSRKRSVVNQVMVFLFHFAKGL
jgi:hypothetical protein